MQRDRKPATPAAPSDAPSGAPSDAPSAEQSSASTQWEWSAGDESPAQVRLRRARIIGRYEDFLRCTVDWLWETDAAQVLTYVSAPVALKLGLPAHVLIGRSLPGLGRFKTTGKAAQAPVAPLEARRPFRNAVFEMTGADEMTVAYRLSGVPYFDEESGRFAGFRGTAVALTPEEAEAGKVEQEMQALAEALDDALLQNTDLAWRLERAAKAAAPAAAVAPPAPPGTPAAPAPEPARPPIRLDRTAHELRTPLNAVIGYADLGLSQVFGPLGDRYVDCFRTIREAGRHLDDVIGQMSALAKRPDQPDLVPEVVDIATIVAKAKAMIALSARAGEVDITRIGPMAGGQVLGDHRACTQILLNLLSNAVKFTPAGGSVGLETIVGPDNILQIVVWDTGRGIAPDEQQKIFEPDYRAAEVRAEKKVPGRGLGLAISRDLARAMGGDLSVISQPGQGSRFILSLPLAGVPDAR